WQRRVEFPVDAGLNASFISREDLLASKLAAGRPQDLADVAALGEHLDPADQRSHEAKADASVSDMEIIKKKAVADWLAHRAQRDAEHGSPSLEETRAKAVENWKRLQKEKTQTADAGTRSRARDEANREPAKGGGKDVAEDPEL